jgi:hypothetical protein
MASSGAVIWGAVFGTIGLEFGPALLGVQQLSITLTSSSGTH